MLSLSDLVTKQKVADNRFFLIFLVSIILMKNWLNNFKRTHMPNSSLCLSCKGVLIFVARVNHPEQP
jgi:hypothetical protein